MMGQFKLARILLDLSITLFQALFCLVPYWLQEISKGLHVMINLSPRTLPLLFYSPHLSNSAKLEYFFNSATVAKHFYNIDMLVKAITSS